MGSYIEHFGKAADYLANKIQNHIIDPIARGAERVFLPENQNLTAAFVAKAGPLEKTQLKNLAADMNDPHKLIRTFEDSIKNYPDSVPAGLVLGSLNRTAGVLSKQQNHPLTPIMARIIDNLKPASLDDSRISRTEMVRAVSNAGNDLNDVQPHKDILQTAKQSIQRLGIDDPKGEVAMGIAKTAISASVNISYFLGNNHDFNTSHRQANAPLIQQP